MIKVNNVRYSIPNKDIIQGIDVCIKRGSFYGILGPNGSGKTTFLDILCGFIENYQGDVDILGKNLKKYSKKELAKLIALVPQNFNPLFSFSVRETLEMGRYPHRKKFAFLGEDDKSILDEIIDDLELLNILDKDITDLSGGERQRVIFGKALVQNTPILILDESTSNLDPYYTHSLLNIVRKLVDEKGVTVLSVFHDFTLASLFCDEIILIKNGEILENGSTRDVLNEKNIKKVFNVNSKTLRIDDTEYTIPYL